MGDGVALGHGRPVGADAADHARHALRAGLGEGSLHDDVGFSPACRVRNTLQINGCDVPVASTQS